MLISGGGIGGLSAALSLARQGFEVKVFEQAPELGEIGAGIQLSPNCTRVLFDVGLEDALRAVSCHPQGGQMRAWRTGRVLAETSLGDSAERAFGFPYLHIHRADLIGVLAQAETANEGIDLRTNSKVTGFAQDGEGVVLKVLRQGAEETHRADVLVGADGIRSVVRDGLFGPESPAFTGNLAWRALVPAGRLPQGMIRPMATVWWGPGKHFVHYYVRRGELVNCVCVVEKAGWQIESWHERGEYEELKADFAGWHADIQSLIDNAEGDSLFKWALFDRQPMSSWGSGRVTLLGDACHPTLPFMAQGAAMSIEDGAVLARCLGRAKTTSDLLPELLAYADLRMKRTARIQAVSRRNANLFHMRGAKAAMRNIGIKLMRPKNALAGVFGYNALTAHESR